MSFKITSVKMTGDLSQERVVMQAQSKVNVGDYALFRCAVSGEDQVESGNVLNAYWFEDHDIEAGDFVVLYTKAGTRSSKVAESGRTSHFFYWDKTSPFWDASVRAVLIHAKPYQFGPLISAA